MPLLGCKRAAVMQAALAHAHATKREKVTSDELLAWTEVQIEIFKVAAKRLREAEQRERDARV